MLSANHHVILGAIEAIRVLGKGEDPAILLKRVLPYLSEEEIAHWLQWYGIKR